MNTYLTACLLALTFLCGILTAKESGRAQRKKTKNRTQEIARVRALSRVKMLQKARCIVCQCGHNKVDEHGVQHGPLKCIQHDDGSICSTNFIHHECFMMHQRNLGNYSCPACDDANPVCVVKPETVDAAQ